MKQTSILALTLTALLALAAVAAPEAGTREPLFNGTTLEGWTVLKCEAAVDQGDILLQSGNGLLQTEKMYADFALEFEWKALAEDNWDSGVYFRYDATPADKPWPDRYQINLRKGMEGNCVGMDNAVSEGMIKERDWNAFKLIVQGAAVELWINGKKACKVSGL